ncbi:Integrase core domain-containing protein [Streptomyces sp. WMMB 714]|nr:Integrase core domain-containing protein [Streptomyces sp. WMMB 714]
MRSGPTGNSAPSRIGPILGLPPSTFHRILARHGLNRLAYLDRPTGRVVRRYERELVHLGIKKVGNIPNGGGWRTVGRTTGVHNRQATTTTRGELQTGDRHSYIHFALDDHSRLAYSEVLTDERKETAAGFWQRAQPVFTRHGITVERVFADNGTCYRSLARDSGRIPHKRSRPHRPQTNGKVERLNRGRAGEMAYAMPYHSGTERRAAFPYWLHTYNHHRAHTAPAGKPLASRVPNLTGQTPNARRSSPCQVAVNGNALTQ